MTRPTFSASEILVTALLLSFATGCQIPAHRLEVAPVKTIVPGSTTRSVIENKFGQPSETMTSPSGNMVARYFFHNFIASTEASISHRWDNPGTVLFRTLTLLYDTNGIVLRKLHDESMTPVRRSRSHWIEGGPNLDPQELTLIKTNETRGADLVARLGEPLSRSLNTDGSPLLIWFYGRDRLDRMGMPEGKKLIDRKSVV